MGSNEQLLNRLSEGKLDSQSVKARTNKKCYIYAPMTLSLDAMQHLPKTRF